MESEHEREERAGRPPRGLTAREERVVEGVLGMYREGWFPMYEESDSAEHRGIDWVQPQRRGIIPLEPDRFRVSRSLRAKVRRGEFSVSSDEAFGEVIRACAAPAEGRGGTWLCAEIVEAFEVLHKAGHAHSVEAWVETEDGERRLVGGLYGLALGSVFCGESMFSRPESGGTDASKVCLVHLVHHLRARGFALLDAQMTNGHLERFGCYEMPREEYLSILREASRSIRGWTPFDPRGAIEWASR